MYKMHSGLEAMESGLIPRLFPRPLPSFLMSVYDHFHKPDPTSADHF